MAPPRARVDTTLSVMNTIATRSRMGLLPLDVVTYGAWRSSGQTLPTAVSCALLVGGYEYGLSKPFSGTCSAQEASGSSWSLRYSQGGDRLRAQCSTGRDREREDGEHGRPAEDHQERLAWRERA